MLRLLCYGLKRNRRAMRTLLFFLTSCLLVIAPTQSSSVQAQSCAQGGRVICGPICGSYFNIVYDPHFEQTSCSRWRFGSGTERAYDIFWGYPSHFGRFNGPSVWRAISQTTEVQPAETNGDRFSFRYEVQINDPLNDPFTTLDVWIIEPNGRQRRIDRITGAQAYQSRSFDLGYQPSWVGQNLGIEFWARQPGNSTISIDNVVLHQSP